MQTKNIGGVELVYRIVGEEGPWLALMPGGRRGHEEILSIARLIAAEGFRVLLHDRRNTGASEIRIGGEESEEEIWADDLAALLAALETGPAFVGGFSSGSRVAMLVGSRHPALVRGLLLARVTGGPTAAKRLPRKYYSQFIEAAEKGGMPAVLATADYQDRVKANPANRDRLLAIPRDDYIAAMRHWRDRFMEGGRHEVLGMSPEALAAIAAPTLIIPGNDRTHSIDSGHAAQRAIPNAQFHVLPIAQQDKDFIPYEEWAALEPAIAAAFVAFMERVGQ